MFMKSFFHQQIQLQVVEIVANNHSSNWQQKLQDKIYKAKQHNELILALLNHLEIKFLHNNFTPGQR